MRNLFTYNYATCSAFSEDYLCPMWDHNPVSLKGAREPISKMVHSYGWLAHAGC